MKHDTKQGQVVCIVAEGAGGFAKRLKAYAIHKNVRFGESFHVINAAPDFTQGDSADVKIIIERCKGASIVVIDTLAQVTAGANENSGDDMGAALSRCKQIRQQTGSMVILVHHAGKTEGRGARGWSGIKAAMDMEIEVTRNGNNRCARITKQKDGEEGAEFHFRLKQVEIGTRKGKPIHSCVVEYIDAPCEEYVPTGKWQKPVFYATKTLGSATHSQITSYVLSTAPAPNGKQDRRRDSIKRAISELCSEGRLVDLDGKLQLPQTHKPP